MRDINVKKICIICEGYEELDYFDTLKSKSIFSKKYEIKTVNVKSINNIVSIYQDKYRSDLYALVLIFCDTDKVPYEKYKEIKRKVNEFHDANIADDIIIFGNPCTMQIILSHFAQIKLTSQSKSINSKYIEKLTGIKNYKATEEQRKELFSKIKRENYNIMKENVKQLSVNDNEISSTNILKFLKNLESDDESWIYEINDRL